MEGREQEVFEDLMEYTTVDSADDISTKEDLHDFFKEVKKDAESKGRDFRISKNFFDSIWRFVRDYKEEKDIEEATKRAIARRRRKR